MSESNKQVARWKQAFKEHGSKCVYCPDNRKVDFSGTLNDYVMSSVDHLIPLSRGGAKSHADNIVPACIACNFYKRNLVIEAKLFEELTERRKDGKVYVKKRSLRHYIHLMRAVVSAEKKRKEGEFQAFRDYVKAA